MADSKQQMVNMLNVLLSKEKIVKAQICQDLQKAHEEMKKLQDQQQENNKRYLKAANIVEEFRGKYNDAQNKVKEWEAKLETAKAILASVEVAKKKIEYEKDDLQSKLQKKNAELE